MGWGSISNPNRQVRFAEECATAISSKKNDTKSLHFRRQAGLFGPLLPSWNGPLTLTVLQWSAALRLYLGRKGSRFAPSTFVPYSGHDEQAQ
jgi:hypothetical protein